MILLDTNVISEMMKSSPDTHAARVYGKILAKRKAIGRPLSVIDAQIAAVARSHGLALAMRNTSDFTDGDVTLINPFSGDGV